MQRISSSESQSHCDNLLLWTVTDTSSKHGYTLIFQKHPIQLRFQHFLQSQEL